MFISKKRFKEEIAKAQEQTEREIYQQQRLCRMEEDLRSSVDEVRRETYKAIDRLESDISQIKTLLDKSTKKGCLK